MINFDIIFIGIILGFVSCACSDPGSLKLGIYNSETNLSDGECLYNHGCRVSNLTCRYLAHLENQAVTQEYYADVESAIDAAKHQKVSAVVYMNENFTDTFVARIALGELADDETITQSTIRVWLDKTGKNVNILKQRLRSAYSDFIKDLIAVCNNDIFVTNIWDAQNAFHFSPLAVYETGASDTNPPDLPKVCGSS